MQPTSLEKLKTFPFFKNLTDAELKLIENIVSEQTIQKKETFIEQDDDDTNVYFILEGLVRIYRLSDNGQEINLAMAGPGEAIGEMAPIFQGKRTAYCEVQEEVKALVLSGASFRKVLTTHPEIALLFLKTFCERLTAANRHLEAIMSLNLKDRTITLLKSLSKYFPDQEIKASQDEIAAILSATRPRVSEVLSELEKEGVIERAHKSIIVKN